MPAGAELELGIGIERIVVDRLGDRAFHHVGDAGHEHDQVRHVADRLIGIADTVVDMDRSRRRDEADEEADADERLEAEGDDAHAVAAHAREERAERDAGDGDDHHQRLVARVGENHRDKAERVDRLVEPVIGVEARLERQRGSGNEREGGGERGREGRAHGGQRLAAAPAASRASRSRWRTRPA